MRAARRDESDEGRKNLHVAVAVFGAAVLLVALKLLIGRTTTLDAEVVVLGHAGHPLRAIVEVLAPDGTLAARGETDPATGRLVASVAPDVYLVRATVNVRESDFGLANAYPQETRLVVTEGAAPPRAVVEFPSIVPYLEKPGQYKIRR